LIITQIITRAKCQLFLAIKLLRFSDVEVAIDIIETFRKYRQNFRNAFYGEEHGQGWPWHTDGLIIFPEQVTQATRPPLANRMQLSNI
jgi:hypothetical protein